MSRCWLGAALAAACASAGAADPSDLWWSAAEPGWGMQLVRGGEVTFATLFVYDEASRPTFYTATLTATGAAWSGPLYATAGPFFAGGNYDPAQVSARIVGEMTFTPGTATEAVLGYAVGGVAVSRNVTRQTLRYDNYSGSYPVTTQRVTARCGDAAANGDRVAAETVAIAHDHGAITLEWTSASRTCRYTGTYAQTGRLGAAQTSYTCSDGEEGDFAFYELTQRDGFVSGRFQGHAISNGCDYRGRFAGLLAM